DLQPPNCNRSTAAGSGPVTAFTCSEQGWQLLIGPGDPIAEYRPSISRIDDFLDSESLRGSEWRAKPLQFLFDLTSMRLRIGRCLYFSPVCSLDSTLDRQRAPVSRRPCIAQVEPLCVAMASASHAKDSPDYD